MMYSEFRHRRPPPTYNASQDHHRRLMTSRQQSNEQMHANRAALQGDSGRATLEAGDNLSLPSSPPPTYRSRASTTRPGIHITFPCIDGDYPSSRPTTYRSHAGEIERPRLDSVTNHDNNGLASPRDETAQPVVTCSTANGGEPAAADMSQSALHQIVNDAVQYLDTVLSEVNLDSDPASHDATANDVTVGLSDNQNPPQSAAGPVIVTAASRKRPKRVNSDTYRVEVSHIQGQPRIDVVSRGQPNERTIAMASPTENTDAPGQISTCIANVDAGTQTSVEDDVTDTPL